MTHYSQSEWTVKTAIDAQNAGPPKPPKHVALPGAKRAVEHDRLLAYQDHGLGEHEIVKRTNIRHRQENADRLTEHHRWINGPYVAAIEILREREQQAKAQADRERAIFQQILADHDGEH